jgi:hypothetical protein
VNRKCPCCPCCPCGKRVRLETSHSSRGCR